MNSILRNSRNVISVALALTGVFVVVTAAATESLPVVPAADPMYLIVFGGKNKVASIHALTPVTQPSVALMEPKAADELAQQVPDLPSLSHQ